MPAEPEQILGGDARSPVVRIGDTVRRPSGAWTPAVHALLRHLEDHSSLVETMETFEREELATMVDLGGAGVSPHARYLARGADGFLRWDLDWLVANRSDLDRAIR